MGISKSFCPLPFLQTIIRTDGSLHPCCNSALKTHNLRETSLEEYFNSSFMINLKNDMLNGVRNNKVCKNCYKDEKLYGKSIRTDYLNNFKFFNEKNYEKLIEHYEFKKKLFPEIIEFHIGNLCNLKCLTCRPEDSSSLLSEDKILKISNYNQDRYNLPEKVVNKTIESIFSNSVKTIDLRGGESMLVPIIKKLLLELPFELCKDKILKIQTNATIYDNDWENIFKKFKSIEIMLSLDAYEKDNEYIRFPSKWTIIEKNLKHFKKVAEKIYVNCTISNLNFCVLDKLINWCLNENLFLHFNILNDPKHFHYTNLPDSIFYKAIENLKKNTNKYEELHKIFDSIPNNNHWNVFCKIINKRDYHRKTNIFSILPELKDFWIK